MIYFKIEVNRISPRCPKCNVLFSAQRPNGQSRARVNFHPSWRRVAGGGPYYPRVVYTIFLPSEAENTTFVFERRERKWYFRPTRQKNCIRFQAKGEGGILHIIWMDKYFSSLHGEKSPQVDAVFMVKLAYMPLLLRGSTDALAITEKWDDCKFRVNYN